MSYDMNVFSGVGRLTKDAELKYSAGGIPIVTISIANNYSEKKGDVYQKATNFFDITYFGKKAEAVAKYLVKGKQIAVTGELRYESWEKEDVKHSKIKILAESVMLLGEISKQDTLMPNAVESVKTLFTTSSDDIPF